MGRIQWTDTVLLICRTRLAACTHPRIVSQYLLTDLTSPLMSRSAPSPLSVAAADRTWTLSSVSWKSPPRTSSVYASASPMIVRQGIYIYIAKHPPPLLSKTVLSLSSMELSNADKTPNVVCSEVFQRLRKLRQRDSSVFAFQATTPTFIPDRPGWRCYDPVVEYQRQGLISPSASQSSMRPIGNAGAPLWRLTSANEDYSLCPTYPRVFVVPAAISDDDLREIAKFRINSRLPAVTYLHVRASLLSSY